jgi:hypothetical protein
MPHLFCTSTSNHAISLVVDEAHFIPEIQVLCATRTLRFGSYGTGEHFFTYIDARLVCKLGGWRNAVWSEWEQ